MLYLASAALASPSLVPRPIRPYRTSRALCPNSRSTARRGRLQTMLYFSHVLSKEHQVGAFEENLRAKLRWPCYLRASPPLVSLNEAWLGYVYRNLT